MLAGAYVAVELTLLAPRASVTFGVTVKVAVALLPLLSVTVTICDPTTPACELAFPSGVENRITADPPSVTVAGVNVAALAEALLPTVTDVIVAVGPKPVSVAVTTVPTGPEAGDNVSVAAPRESVVHAMLPHASTSLNAVPDVTAGRLTVAVVVPVALILLLLSTADEVVVTPEATVIAVPANDAESMVFVYVIPVGATGKPEPVTVTESPAATVAGETATEGVVIVNVPATTEVVASVIMTVCAPTERPYRMILPLKPPVELVAN